MWFTLIISWFYVRRLFCIIWMGVIQSFERHFEQNWDFPEEEEILLIHYNICSCWSFQSAFLDGLSYGFQTCLASPHNYLIQFLATNLSVCLSIYPYIYLCTYHLSINLCIYLNHLSPKYCISLSHTFSLSWTQDIFGQASERTMSSLWSICFKKKERKVTNKH